MEIACNALKRQEEHRHQEVVLGSDSELSELASSVFDGMEGIEMSTLVNKLTDRLADK